MVRDGGRADPWILMDHGAEKEQLLCSQHSRLRAFVRKAISDHDMT